MSASSDEKDPFRYRHMIPTDALQVRSLANAGKLNTSTVSPKSAIFFLCVLNVLISASDGDSSAVCEIVHTKSESEGRPERTFQLCCR